MTNPCTSNELSVSHEVIALYVPPTRELIGFIIGQGKKKDVEIQDCSIKLEGKR